MNRAVIGITAMALAAMLGPGARGAHAVLRATARTVRPGDVDDRLL